MCHFSKLMRSNYAIRLSSYEPASWCHSQCWSLILRQLLLKIFQSIWEQQQSKGVNKYLFQECRKVNTPKEKKELWNIQNSANSQYELVTKQGRRNLDVQDIKKIYRIQVIKWLLESKLCIEILNILTIIECFIWGKSNTTFLLTQIKSTLRVRQ